MMENLDGQIWVDGSFCDWKDAKIHILTHTLHYGTGVFEGVRAYETESGPAIFRLEDHTDRLFDSAKTLGIENHHDIGIGNIHSHFDHGRRNHHFRFPLTKPRHHSLLFLRG